MKRDDHVLITGATGFLGSAIVAKAVESGLSITATDRVGSAQVSGVPVISADILDPNSLSKIFEGSDCVCHVAGLAHIFNESEALLAPFDAVNVIGTGNVAHAAAQAGVCHFLLISSVSVYGPYTQGMCDETTACNPLGPYAISKYNAELRAIEIARESGMALTILRLATLYGENDPGNIYRLICSLDKGRFVWIGDGSNRKSLLYKEDAARACVAVMEGPATGINIYNVSAPQCTMREIVNTIAKELGRNPLPVRLPGALVLNIANFISNLSDQRFVGLHTMIQKWLAEDVYNTNRFEELYGFQTNTSIEDGLKREINWYRHKQQNGQLAG